MGNGQKGGERERTIQGTKHSFITFKGKKGGRKNRKKAINVGWERNKRKDGRGRNKEKKGN